MMGRTKAKREPRCTVCARADVAEIDRRLVRGATLRALAAKLGVSKSALARHDAHRMRATAAGDATSVKPASAADVRANRSARAARRTARPVNATRAEMAAELEGHARRLLDELADDEDLTVPDRAKIQTSIVTTLGQAAKLAREEVDVSKITEAQLAAHPAMRTFLERIARSLRPWPDALKAAHEAIKEAAR